MENTETAPVQTIHDGTGAYFHRRYFIDMKRPKKSAIELMAEVKKNPNQFSPRALASFEKTKGAPDHMQVGDEFKVHISGPWNAPVRVIKETPTSFTFATLEGHLEAGTITFSAEVLESGVQRFQIESFARSKDGLVNFLYDKIPVIRFAQMAMWTGFCEEFAHKCGDDGNLHVVTEKRDENSDRWEIVKDVTSP